MMLMLSFFVAILACFTMAVQQTGPLKEVEEILKNVAAQRTQKYRLRGLQYHPRYSELGLKQRNQDREENDRSYDSAQSMEFYHQLENMRIEKQLENDLQQALMSESNRICKTTGRCGCSGGRCGTEYRAVDRTVNEMEQLLKELNKDINKQRNRNFQSDEDRRQKNNNRREKYTLDQQLYENELQKYQDRQQNDRRQKYNDRRLRQNERNERQGDRRQKQSDKRQEYDEERQEYEDKRQRQEQDDRLQELEDRRQEYNVQRQDYQDANDGNVIKNLGIATKTYKNSDFDIVVLDVPESNEFHNRANNIRLVDITESAIKDLLQQQQTSQDKKKQKDHSVGNLNLEDFVAYYRKIKEELTTGLMKYVKGSDDGSYLGSLLPYQRKQIENLKNLQVKRPRADDDLKAKIVELLFGSLSNIKILPHSKDSQTIYIPQQVMDAVPSVIRQKALRSRLLPLTYYQKQRQRNSAPRNVILNHSWRRNNRQASNYGIPFNLQVQGLGQVN